MYTENWLKDETLDSEFREYILQAVVDTLGAISIIDQHGKLIYVNDRYTKQLAFEKSNILGKNIKDVLKNTGLLNVLNTGKPDIGALYQWRDKTYILNRFPIFKNDEIVGVVGHSIFSEFIEISKLKYQISKIKEELEFYKKKYEKTNVAKYNLDDIISLDDNVLRIKDSIKKIAKTNSNILITGESGVGKELFCHAIHSQSSRAFKPFIRINCGAIPENLIESELFGYEKGSFTGALNEGKAGEFEIANGGTVLMDEIDSLPLQSQSKLLRVLQEREVKRIGGSKYIDIDLRFIFTTNRNLVELISEKKFREDLYYRINVVNIRIPPLRNRKTDIPHLIKYFIDKYNTNLEMNITGISDEAMEMLIKKDWPGNIRELENYIERAFNYALVGKLEVNHFDFSNNIDMDNKNSSTIIEPDLGLRNLREEIEIKAIKDALTESKGNKKKASEILKIDRSVLYDKLKKYKI